MSTNLKMNEGMHTFITTLMNTIGLGVNGCYSPMYVNKLNEFTHGKFSFKETNNDKSSVLIEGTSGNEKVSISLGVSEGSVKSINVF